MKVWARWGFEDMGVFIDWTSLYQNHPHPRSAEQQASFKRALKTMNIWIFCASSLTYWIAKAFPSSWPAPVPLLRYRDCFPNQH